MNETIQDMLYQLQRTAVQVGDLAADAAYGVGKGASHLWNTARQKAALMDLKAEVQVHLRELGELLYATHTGNPTDSEVLLAKMQEIDALSRQYEEMI